MYILHNHNTASRYLNVDCVKLEIVSPEYYYSLSDGENFISDVLLFIERAMSIS
jgi:hypothetical protein